jgi:hypothetical protein
MSKIKVEIKNLAQIRMAFLLSPAVMTKNLNLAIRRVALNIERDSKKFTPVKTGFLKSSHNTSFSNLKGVIQPTANYAAFVHDGTRFMKGRPFLADSVEVNEGFTDAEFEKAVEDTLESLARSIS